MTAIEGPIQHHRGTAANWTANNPTLLAGELGYETDTGRAKVGDGSTPWTSLAYRFESGGGGGSGPLDAEQFDRTSTTPGSISVDLSSVTKAGAVIFVDGASDVTVTALPDSSAFPVFFVYVARITGTGVCTLTFDGGAPVYDGDQYTATSEANGQAAIGLVPLGSGENWLVDSVFPAGGGSGPDLSDADPEDLGTADPGVSPDASRADHVHAMPTAADVGAATEAYADGKVADAINDGTTTVAPSQNAVYDALALKAPIANAVHTGTFEVPTAKHTGNTGASTTPLLITGANASGAPASGAHVKGEIAGDDTGKLWYCTVAGTPGTWVAIGGAPAIGTSTFNGTQDFGLPGVILNDLSNGYTFTAGRVYYTPFMVLCPITVDRIYCEVYAAVASSNLRMGVYAADKTWQPTGPPLIDSGNVGSATTGGKTVTVSVTLQPGLHLAALMVDTNGVGVRTCNARPIWGSSVDGANLGATTALIHNLRYGTQTFGSYPTTSAAWTSAARSSSSQALDPAIFLRYTA